MVNRHHWEVGSGMAVREDRGFPGGKKRSESFIWLTVARRGNAPGLVHKVGSHQSKE